METLATSPDLAQPIDLLPPRVVNRTIKQIGLTDALNLVLFCYRATLLAIQALQKHEYSSFDALTKTNCCHGTASLALEIIESVDMNCLPDMAVSGLRGVDTIRRLIEQVSSSPIDDTSFGFDHDLAQACLKAPWYISDSVLRLTKLYILGLIRDRSIDKGDRTRATELTCLAPLSRNFCETLVKHLQVELSNEIADYYSVISDRVGDSVVSSGAPMLAWRKYVQEPYVRQDRWGAKYVSNLFSMRVVLANLIYNKNVISVIFDKRDQEGTLRQRYVHFLQGNGRDGFRPIPNDVISDYELHRPVVVYSGCAYVDEISGFDSGDHLLDWLHQIDRLFLACDIQYPQFPNIRGDPDFDSRPISTSEPVLGKLLQAYSSIQGVGAMDPSLFCLTHIFPASLVQVLHASKEIASSLLPSSFLATPIRK